jgi:hypothetical protein
LYIPSNNLFNVPLLSPSLPRLSTARTIHRRRASSNELRIAPETWLYANTHHSHARTHLIPNPPCPSRHSSPQPGKSFQTTPHTASLPHLYQANMQYPLPSTFVLSPVMFGNSSEFPTHRLSYSRYRTQGRLSLGHVRTAQSSRTILSTSSITSPGQCVLICAPRCFQAYVDEHLGSPRVQTCTASS